MSMISILVAIYKNCDNIIPFIDNFNSVIAPALQEKNIDYELIFTNDDSPDESWDILVDLTKKYDFIKAIKLSRNFGAMSATYTGMMHAKGDCITVKSCDLQEPPELLLNMLEEWMDGAKVVLGVRESRNDGKMNDFFSDFYYKIIRKCVSKDMPQRGFDVYLIDKVVKEQILIMKENNAPIPLQILWLGYHPREVEYKRLGREIGKSSWSLAKKVKMTVDSIISFSYIPIRVMTLIGFAFVVFSIIYGIASIIAKIRGIVPVEGYTTLLIILMFSSGIIMMTLGILGEYMWRCLEASKRRQISVVEEKIGFENE